MTEAETINKVTDNRPISFFELLKERAYELCPDYPFTKNDAFEWLWALTSSLQGAEQACDEWADYCLRIKQAAMGLAAEFDHRLKRTMEAVPFRTEE